MKPSERLQDMAELDGAQRAEKTFGQEGGNGMKNKKKNTLILFIIVFSAMMGLLITSMKNKGLAELAEKETSSKEAVPVVLTKAKALNFKESLILQGNLEAKNSSLVSPKIPGTIEKIFVDEGDQVKAGKTKLFLIDSEKLQKAVDIQKQGLKVSHYERLEKEADFERVKADFHKADLDYQRAGRLHQKKTITDHEFELQESRFKQAEASLKHAQTLIDLKAQEEQQAEVNLQMAEKDLRDSLVYAPISGKVSLRFSEPGEMGQPGQPIIRIEDLSLIEVSAFLPAQYYPQVRPGETEMQIIVSDLDLGKQKVSYKSPTINDKLRTFEVKCRLLNPPDWVAPGAMAQVEVILQERSNLGVPLAAVQIRGGRPTVFVVSEGKAHLVEVKTGLENDGWVEVLEGELAEHKLVVTMGQLLLNEGSIVRIQKEEN